MENARSLARVDAQRAGVRWAVVGAIALACLLLLAAATLAGFRIARPGVLPGTVVGTVDSGSDGAPPEAELVAVGGLPFEDLEDVIAELASAREAEAIVVTADGSGNDSAAGTAADAGYRLDASDTTAAVWRRGRQPNPLAALADHVRALRGRTLVPPVESVDPASAAAWSADVADELDRDPVDGAVGFSGGSVQRTEPVAGRAVDVADLEDRVAVAAGAPGDQEVPAAVDTIEPANTPEEISALESAAELAVSGPVHLSREDATIALEPEQLGDLFDAALDAGVEPPDDANFGVDPDDLGELVDDETREELESDPVDAEIVLADGSPTVEESVDGFAFDLDRAAEQVAEVAASEFSLDGAPREAELAGESITPDRTTEDAEDLGVTERVASFTTEHPCCQPRVQNIQRMADAIAGTLVEPGKEFSINDHVGARTRAAGYVEDAMIRGGEFVDVVGGGVSQFATTFFNAVYFGGYEILEHKPHSYYISRYPMGHEATLSYGSLDVRFRNDSPYGLLLGTRYSSTSITVDVYSTEWVDVSSSVSNRSNVRQPSVNHREVGHLDPGEERVVQSGRDGFDVTYTRTLDYHDGGSDQQSWTHRYLPEPRIVERNSSSPEPEPEPEPPADEATHDEPDADADAGADADADADSDPDENPEEENPGVENPRADPAENAEADDAEAEQEDDG